MDYTVFETRKISNHNRKKNFIRCSAQIVLIVDKISTQNYDDVCEL